jgi:HEAT repeat protein
MREELKPGFVRNDGVTTSQPLTALYFIAQDKAFVSRLAPLLRHPAFVPRIYVAMTLGKLQARETVPKLVEIIREGYPFSDATALASGKHFDQSQTVRWRGFFCLALGRMGGHEARLALEQIAVDPQAYRDLRYGAVVGLGFIGSPKSLLVLQEVARQDIIWMVRDAARESMAAITLFAKEERRTE